MCPQADIDKWDKMMHGKLFFPLGEFYVFVHVMYTSSSKLPNCRISVKHAKWKLRLSGSS